MWLWGRQAEGEPLLGWAWRQAVGCRGGLGKFSMVTAVCNSAGHPLPANGHLAAIMGLHASGYRAGAGKFPADDSPPRPPPSPETPFRAGPCPHVLPRA